MIRVGLPIIVALASLLAWVGCKPKPDDIIIPGKTKNVTLVVKVAGLSAGDLAAIGSFTMTSVEDGKDGDSFALNYSSSSSTLEFLDDPPALPTKGTLSFRFVGNDLAGDPLPVGGTTRTLDLDQVPRGGDATLFAVIGHSDGLDDLDAPLLDARFSFTASGAGTGFVVVGGYTDGTFAAPGALATTAEWHDLATGVSCASNGGAACSFGDVPPPRVGHIAVALGDFFAPSCPDTDAVLVGLGADANGNARNDLFVFRPSRVGEGGEGGFERLELEGVTARENATAFGTADCRVIITGGVNSGTASLITEVLTFGVGGVEHAGGPSLSEGGRIGALASPSGNALGEVAIVGGTDSTDAAVDSAAVFATAQGRLDLCESDDDDCNDGVSVLACARARPAIAALAGASDDFPTLVVGGDVAAAGCASAEILVSRADAPYTRFIGVSNANDLALRTQGHVAVPFGAGRVLIAGGTDPQPNEIVSVVSVNAANAQLAVSEFPTVPAFSAAVGRAGLAAAHVGGAVLILGGVEGAPVANVYVAVPEAP